MARKTFEGVLNVFRDSSMVEHLSADVKFKDGTSFFWYRSPKCFNELTTGRNNLLEVSFIADEDGKNPRNVKVIRYIGCDK